MKKNKYFWLLSSFILLFSLGANLVSAIEVPLPGLGNNPTLSSYIIYFFTWGISIAGFLALVSFAIGAVGLIISGDNPELASSSKDRMKGAVLGLVLTLASFIIIKTINPTLTAPTVTALPAVPGVFLTNGSQQKPCPEESADTSTLPTGFNTIQYTCSGTGPVLLVWMYPNKNFSGNNGGYGGVNVQRVNCNSQIGVGGGSFQMEFETPGIYYYLGSGCSGYGSDAITGSQDNIEDPFNGNLNSIRIVDDPTNNLYYGALFHKESGLTNGGDCALPIVNQAGCLNLAHPDYTSAVDIFKYNDNPGASGDGVTFFSNPYGWNTGANAGFLNIPDNGIYSPFSWDTSKMIYNYTNVNQPNEYQLSCRTFQDCPGSIKIKGTYLLALYSGASANTPSYCQTFTQDVPNLKAQPFLASGDKNIYWVYIIPTK